jgi:nicotinamidase-related amidase
LATIDNLPADDALVNDVQREIWGAEAIREWVRRDVTGVKAVTTKITRAQRHYDVFIVTTEHDGDYGKTEFPDPLELTFYFHLEQRQDRRRGPQLVILEPTI